MEHEMVIPVSEFEYIMDARKKAEERAERLEQAIDNAAYALDPNQGEPPDPVQASMWLRSTFPPDHPNYVDPAMLAEQDNEQ